MAAAQIAFGTAVKGFREESAARIVRIDVLLLVAAVGLIACSIYTLGTATEDDIAGQPVLLRAAGSRSTAASGWR